MNQLFFEFTFSKVASEQNYKVLTPGNLQEVFA